MSQTHFMTSLTQWFRPSPDAVDRSFPSEEMRTTFDVVAPLGNADGSTRDYEGFKTSKDTFGLPFHPSIDCIPLCRRHIG